MSYEEKFRGVDSVIHSGTTHHGLKCGHCNREVSALEIAQYQSSKGDTTYWLICSVCSHGLLLDRNGKLYPPASYGVKIDGLPSEVEEAYTEARNCMSINAFTSCQLICRKILMHIATDKCSGKEGDTFKNYIKNIEDAQYITPPMKPWVTRIKDE